MPKFPEEELILEQEIDAHICQVKGYRNLFKVSPCIKFKTYLLLYWPSRKAFQEANNINNRTLEAWIDRKYYVYDHILLKPAKRFVDPCTDVDLLVTCHPIVPLQEFMEKKKK